MEWFLIVGGLVVCLIWRASQLSGEPSTASGAPTPEGEPLEMKFSEAVEVVGESNYQPALLAAAGGKTPDGAAKTEHIAVLVPEPFNPYDKNAVRVEIRGRLVGYVPKAKARELTAMIREARAPVGCRARITGGWDRGDGDTGSFGVVLLDGEGNA